MDGIKSMNDDDNDISRESIKKVVREKARKINN